MSNYIAHNGEHVAISCLSTSNVENLIISIEQAHLEGRFIYPEELEVLKREFKIRDLQRQLDQRLQNLSSSVRQLSDDVY